MDGTTTMQGTEQEVQDTAAEMHEQQTAESTPEKVSALQKFINGLFGGGKEDDAEPEKKRGKTNSGSNCRKKLHTGRHGCCH